MCLPCHSRIGRSCLISCLAVEQGPHEVHSPMKEYRHRGLQVGAWLSLAREENISGARLGAWAMDTVVPLLYFFLFCLSAWCQLRTPEASPGERRPIQGYLTWGHRFTAMGRGIRKSSDNFFLTEFDMQVRKPIGDNVRGTKQSPTECMFR